MSDHLEALSVRLEDETGYDSIPTIRETYRRSNGGAYCCPFPGCDVRRRDPVDMWRHIHFGAKHQLSFGKSFGEVTAAPTQETRP